MISFLISNTIVKDVDCSPQGIDPPNRVILCHQGQYNSIILINGAISCV